MTLFFIRVRDRGVCLSSCCWQTLALSSLELEELCVQTAEQSERRQPDPSKFLFRFRKEGFAQGHAQPCLDIYDLKSNKTVKNEI